MELCCLILTIIICLVVFAIYWYLKNVHPLAVKIRWIPRPEPTNFFLGNITLFFNEWRRGKDFSQLVIQLTRCVATIYDSKRIYMFWLGWEPFVILYKPETIEAILGNQNQLQKAQSYEYLHPWLGEGLLTSTGRKWRTRRKLLTPTFHFRILEDFIPIFNEQSKILIEKLSGHTYVDDIMPYVATCTLDIICETAMGTKINAQSNPESEYVEAIAILSESFMQRHVNWYMWWTPMFKLTSYGKKYYKALETLHGITRNIIKERKAKMKSITKKTYLASRKEKPFSIY